MSILVARVVPAAGVERPQDLPDAVLTHAAASLARYKQPRRVDLVEGLRRTPNGKLIRRG